MEGTSHKKKWTIMVIVILSNFMSTLDSSIVNVALPSMAQVLGVTTANIQLVATSYLIVIAGTVLIFGRLGDLLGKAKVFTIGLGIFTLGSLLCGLTHSFVLLILARMIQAIGAAGTMANNQGIIAETFPSNERGKALGLNATAVALGSLVGPGLGGLIVGAISWEYIFLINIPIGLVTLFLCIKLLPKGRREAIGRFDSLGATLFLIAIVLLFSAMNEGLNRGFTDPLILSGFLLSAVSLLAFFIVERKRENPMLQLQIFRNTLFSLSIFCGCISYLVIFCNNIILPFYLQYAMTFSPQYTGLILMIYPLILSIVAPVSGHLSDKIGSELLTFLGLILTGTGLFLMSSLSENSTLPNMALFIGIMSVGMGIFQSPNNSLIMSTVSRDMLGIAGSINALVRNLGMVCGIALATTLLYSRMSAKIGYRVTDYVVERRDAFLYGMRAVYITAGGIAMFGAVLTLVRLINKRKRRRLL
jgi:EmrB/QacA subfamily drug resistance transporter